MTPDERSIARKTLQNMIPNPLPTVEGLDMAALYLPCEQIGGDLFDVFPIAPDTIAFVIFDVSGQGVASALIAAMCKVCFANNLRQLSSPRAVIERVNASMGRYLCHTCFVSAFVGYLDLHDNKLTYCNAGLCGQFVYTKNDNHLRMLTPCGTAIGVRSAELYTEHCVHLHPGDWLLIHTKGVYSLFAQGDERLGRQHFEAYLAQTLEAVTPGELMNRLKDRFSQTPQESAPQDDIALLGVNVLTQSRRDQLKKQLGFEQEDPVYLQTIFYFEEMEKTTAVILKAMDNQGFADDAIRKMKITLTELLVNAIDHGNNKDSSKRVTVGHLIDKTRVMVSVMDEGEGFDPAAVPDPTLPENLVKDSGRGLFIVRCYVDSLSFNEKGNRITIVKAFG